MEPEVLISVNAEHLQVLINVYRESRYPNHSLEYLLAFRERLIEAMRSAQKTETSIILTKTLTDELLTVVQNGTYPGLTGNATNAILQVSRSLIYVPEPEKEVIQESTAGDLPVVGGGGICQGCLDADPIAANHTESSEPVPEVSLN